MKYFALLILFISGFSFSQADLIIPITVSNNSLPPSPWDSLQIGLDSTATDSIDEHLGEYILPPIPPPGWPVFLILPDNSTGVHKDFRFGELPFSGVKEHRLRFWDGATISWELPSGVTGQLLDLFGGVIINIPMSGSGSYYVSNFAINELKMILTYNNVTPVELTSFTASLSVSSVQLNWVTASEINNSGFEILRHAQNEYDWRKIGFVQGFGTTTESKSYSFIDENVREGIYKYRLKQIDFDGTCKYSDEVEIIVESTSNEFVLDQNYPNPFNPTTTINYSLKDNSQVSLKIFNTLGEEIKTLVNEIKPAGNFQVEFDASELPSGVYIYRMQAGDFVSTKKMLMLK